MPKHYYINSKEKCHVILRAVTYLFEIPLSCIQNLALQHALSDILVQTGFILANHSKSNRNKAYYKANKMVMSMLRLSSNIGPVSQILSMGVYFYNIGCYHRVQNIIELCRQRFSQPFVLFVKFDEHWQQYLKCVGKYSLGKRMNNAWMSQYFNCISYISETIFRKRFLFTSSLIRLISHVKYII